MTYIKQAYGFNVKHNNNGFIYQSSNPCWLVFVNRSLELARHSYSHVVFNIHFIYLLNIKLYAIFFQFGTPKLLSSTKYNVCFYESIACHILNCLVMCGK